MKKIIWLLVLPIILFGANSAALKNLSLKNAENIVKKDNLEISIAKFDEQMRVLDVKVAKGYNYGKLDLTQIFVRSNDALSVFGAKLMSREATFGDFGFRQFLSPPPGTTNILKVQPTDLNYPGYRNLFQTKLMYKVPIYTGGKLTQYRKIAQEMVVLSKLDSQKVISKVLFQTKKTFFNITLLDNYIINLNIILKNMNILENTVKSMIEVGYAKHVDLLEVQAKKSNVLRMLNQAKVNRKLAYRFLSFLLNKNVKSIIHVNEDKVVKNINKIFILSKNLDIKRAKEGLKISKMNIRLKESAFLPEVGAFGEFSTADDTFLSNFRKHDAYTIGVQFKWNLFNGGVDKTNLEKARVKSMKIAEQLELAKKGIALKIDKIETEIESIQFDINSLNEELKLSHTIYKNYLGRYKEKLVSINDVIIKQSQEIERVLKLEKVKTKRNEKIFELEKIANGDIK
jgi:outer membrane protein TolC